ncbi:alpha/beta hydrolase [Phenylobacterium sp. LjRoot225]|uniref:alpha/beta hydrolase n=1 Tax=Phenylobacterium sp. LjRoot225 TaxID=3342285 RepID=UPI003ECEACD9
MPVLSALKPLFDAIAAAPRAEFGSLAEARAATHAAMEHSIVGFYARHEPLLIERDHRVEVEGGAITVRLYAPAAPARPLPCHVYYHGGSFWLGTLDHFDSLCRGLAKDAGCIVAAVDYRLAPEHRFPTAPEDCYAALSWVVEQAAELGVDASRVSVGGVSAGGNLAAVVALMARDRGGPALRLQVLEIPITDLTCDAPLRAEDEGVVLPSDKPQVRSHYLSDAAEARDPYASPLLAADLRNLPPALIMTAEYDPLRAEGAAYARRLAEAGVAVEHHCWEGQFHGAQPLAALIPAEAAAYQDEVARALRRAYGFKANRTA